MCPKQFGLGDPPYHNSGNAQKKIFVGPIGYRLIRYFPSPSSFAPPPLSNFLSLIPAFQVCWWIANKTNIQICKIWQIWQRWQTITKMTNMPNVLLGNIYIYNSKCFSSFSFPSVKIHVPSPNVFLIVRFRFSFPPQKYIFLFEISFC